MVSCLFAYIWSLVGTLIWLVPRYPYARLKRTRTGRKPDRRWRQDAVGGPNTGNTMP